MKAPTRVSIFSYNTFASTLLMDSKSLEIKFRKKFITLETLFELESVLAWCGSHPEVVSIYFTAYGDQFIQGVDEEELATLSPDKLKKIYYKLSTISQSFFCLPQTIVMDLKGGTSGIGLELALSADIRLASENAQFSFNHLAQGLTPTCGTFSFLSAYLNQNVLRSLLLSGKTFNVQTLNLLGGYTDTETTPAELLKNIFNQAPVARMQAKRGLLGENMTTEVNQKINVEREIFNATISTGDFNNGVGKFMGHAEFKEKVRQQEV